MCFFFHVSSNSNSNNDYEKELGGLWFIAVLLAASSVSEPVATKKKTTNSMKDMFDTTRHDTT